MQSEYTLMLENKPVLYFHLDDMEVSVLDEKLLPFSLRGKIKNVETDNAKEYYKTAAKNISLIKEYASSKVLSLSRENAKQIYAACNLIQDNSVENRFQICMLCKGVNLQDSYWFKVPESTDTWEIVNPKTHRLSEILDIALAGKSPTFTADSSEILDCMNVPHVHYKKAIYENMIVAKSENFVPEHLSFVEAEEVYKYCKNTGKDFLEFALRNFSKDFANIAVVDFILQNTDRHLQNYGFFMDNETGQLTGVAPLFDHNQALVADMMGIDVTNTMSQMLNTKATIQEIFELFAYGSAITIDCVKWLNLKQNRSEYKTILERVEKRIAKVPHIQKLVDIPYKQNLSEMADYLEKQLGVFPDVGNDLEIGKE